VSIGGVGGAPARWCPAALRDERDDAEEAGVDGDAGRGESTLTGAHSLTRDSSRMHSCLDFTCVICYKWRRLRGAVKAAARVNRDQGGDK